MKIFTFRVLIKSFTLPALFTASLLSSCNTASTTQTATDAAADVEAVAVEAVTVAAAPAATAINRNPEVEETLWNQHASMKTTINSSNVGSMALNWKYATPTPVSHTPLVDETGIYFGDWGGTVYKVDASTGKLIWKKEIEKPQTMWPWHGFAGTGTLGEGKLFEASVEGTAFALNPATGDVLWKTRFTDDTEAGNLSTLLYHDGLVYIGVSSVEEPMTGMKKDFKPDFQGKVVALRASDGTLAWERVLVEPPHNGCAVWSSFALDPDLNMLYFTTGNNYTGEATNMSDAIIAVDAKTGQVKWHNQVTQHDVWTKADQKGPDYDFAGGPQLFVADVNGQPRKLVGAGQKSGIFYSFDAQTGEKIWSTNIGYGGIDGGMHGEASIGDGSVLTWSNNSYVHTMPPDKVKISVKKLNAATGEHQWVVNHAQPAAIVPGYLANDVYFLGSLDGTLQAYNAKDGKQLMTTKVPAPIISWLWVDGNNLYFGGGVPGMFKWADKGENGVYAYTVKR
ncbi:PQQ-binding-like beta-propeller repeat protein [Pontibacter locisalis]|uniref:PQQ-binding-like beta-propeller repeat protein n=1 Tax=Pontibacter locisalis TaxID=1719035 RepID=A0ABW5IPU2_9BACT